MPQRTRRFPQDDDLVRRSCKDHPARPNVCLNRQLPQTPPLNWQAAWKTPVGSKADGSRICRRQPFSQYLRVGNWSYAMRWIDVPIWRLMPDGHLD
jgi:hypothetical protein